MSPVRAAFHSALIECLEAVLAPLVRLTLHCGLGHSEFAAIVRRVFIDVASEEFGLRGRPANASRISAKTGLSRKAIQKLRAQDLTPEWSPDEEVSPINTIIHYWRFDEQFGSLDGTPKELSYEGQDGFISLVRKYGGDIPASTIRHEFLRAGLATQTEDGRLKLVREFSFPERLDEDFLRNAAFSIGHHTETVLHNALIADSGKAALSQHELDRRLERIAWSRRLSEGGSQAFQLWVQEMGEQFISAADEYISRHEDMDGSMPSSSVPVTGVGIYFFTKSP
jgi:hypothetical protein